MASISADKLNEEIFNIKQELSEIKARLGEEFELSEYAKKELAKARKEMKTSHVKHEDIMRKYG